MQEHEKLNGKVTSRSFKASALRVDPSLIAIACYLARIAAEKDYEESLMREQTDYTIPNQKEGPA